jgi:Mg2+/Co2+ transporter CorB
MNTAETSVTLILVAIFVLILLSAYFSGSETAMMALNRYRLRHLVNEGHPGARRANELLSRPDRLLGVILIGNNFVNFLAASLATVIGLRLLGDVGLVIAPIVLTFVFLIFAEVAPKTIAAQYPEALAYPSSYVLQPLLRLLYPFVWLVNAISNALLRPLGVNTQGAVHDRLSIEELRTVLHESAQLPIRRQNMLLGILDLEKITVDDIMVTREEIEGIDIDDNLGEIVNLICSSQHTRLPVYKDNVNNIIGVLHLRRAARFLREEELTKAAILQETLQPYFVPEGTPLHTQLFNFQQHQERLGIVVDEYGDVQGIVALEDILEEIVGEFTTDVAASIPEIHPQSDGTYIIDGGALLRDINRSLGWALPTRGPRTLNGLILEHLEMIPESNVCVGIDEYRIETLQIKDNMIRSAHIWRAQARTEGTIEVADES